MKMNQLRRKDISTLFVPPPDISKGHSWHLTLGGSYCGVGVYSGQQVSPGHLAPDHVEVIPPRNVTEMMAPSTSSVKTLASPSDWISRLWYWIRPSRTHSGFSSSSAAWEAETVLNALFTRKWEERKGERAKRETKWEQVREGKEKKRERDWREDAHTRESVRETERAWKEQKSKKEWQQERERGTDTDRASWEQDFRTRGEQEFPAFTKIAIPTQKSSSPKLPIWFRQEHAWQGLISRAKHLLLCIRLNKRKQKWVNLSLILWQLPHLPVVDHHVVDVPNQVNVLLHLFPHWVSKVPQPAAELTVLSHSLCQSAEKINCQWLKTKVLPGYVEPPTWGGQCKQPFCFEWFCVQNEMKVQKSCFSVRSFSEGLQHHQTPISPQIPQPWPPWICQGALFWAFPLIKYQTGLYILYQKTHQGMNSSSAPGPSLLICFFSANAMADTIVWAFSSDNGFPDT